MHQDAGMDYYLVKPVQISELDRTMDRYRSQ